VGDPVDHATLEFCAPEVLRALQVHAWCPAAFSMDLFSLGRIIMWLASTDNDLWPDLPEDCSDAVKEAFLLSDTEFSLYGIHDDATRDIINRLLQKSPQDRLTLKQLQDTTYVKMDMYTRKLYLKPNRECCRLS
jgi:serine/threonine protein kinase